MLVQKQMTSGSVVLDWKQLGCELSWAQGISNVDWVLKKMNDDRWELIQAIETDDQRSL